MKALKEFKSYKDFLENHPRAESLEEIRELAKEEAYIIVRYLLMHREDLFEYLEKEDKE